MNLTVFLVVVILSVIELSLQKQQCFRAAVYECIHLGSYRDIDPDDVYQFVRWNLESCSIAAKKARNSRADILVLPEDFVGRPTQMKGHPELSERSVMKMLAEDIPNPSVNIAQPCTDQDFSDRPIMKRFSCIAKENKLYLIATQPTYSDCDVGVNGCPNDGFFMYNTQVVFDRSGNLIAWYHKYHLFAEPYFNMPTKQELSFFDTDFGARIGLFNCIDRIYKNPMIPLIENYNVTTMALSTLHHDLYPFMMSHQIDQAWSEKLRVNILTANNRNPGLGTTGSGIYSPDEVKIYEHDSIDVGARIESVLLIASLPVDPKSDILCNTNPKRITISHDPAQVIPGTQRYRITETKFNNDFTIVAAKGSSGDVTACSKRLCCRLQYTKNNLTSQGVEYIFAVTSRIVRFMPGHGACEESCMFIAYDRQTHHFLKETDVQFTRIKISSSSFSTPYVFSSALENNYRLIAQKDIVYGNESLEIIDYSRPVLFAGMYGRCFDKDPPYFEIARPDLISEDDTDLDLSALIETGVMDT